MFLAFLSDFLLISSPYEFEYSIHEQDKGYCKHYLDKWVYDGNYGLLKQLIHVLYAGYRV